MKRKNVESAEQVHTTTKRYGSAAIFCAVCIGLVFIGFNLKPIGKGLILGSIFSAVNFALMGKTLPLKLGVSKNRATLISGVSILVRYGLLAIPLLMSIKMTQFNLVATVCGLFMIQFLILSDQILHLAYPSRQKSL